jgi:hypothetical protein
MLGVSSDTVRRHSAEPSFPGRFREQNGLLPAAGGSSSQMWGRLKTELDTPLPGFDSLVVCTAGQRYAGESGVRIISHLRQVERHGPVPSPHLAGFSATS